MKIAVLRLSAAFLFILCLTGWSFSSPGEDEFLKKFLAAYQAGDQEGMKKAIATDAQGAIDAFLTRMDRYGAELDDALGKEVEAMKAAWNEVQKNQFFENEYKYLSRIDSGTRRRRQELLGNWRSYRALFEKTRGTAQEDGWASLEKNLPALVESFEMVGDLYFASLAQGYLAMTFDGSTRPKGNNPRTALEHYKKFIEMRERLDLKDGYYNQIKALADRLEKIYKKTEQAGNGEGGEGSAIPFKAGSQWQTFAMSVVKPETLNDLDRYGYDGDEIYSTWTRLLIEQKNPVCTFPNFPNKVSLVREGAAKFMLDQDGDGKGDIKLKATSGKPELIEFSRSIGPLTDSYALWLVTGSSQETIQRVQTNAAPTQESATFFYRSAAARSADVLGESVRMIDENIDGKFNYDILERPVDGIEKTPLPFLDSWVIGKGKRAAPASAYAQLGDKWYRVEFDGKNLGQELRLREVDASPGTLALDFKGPASLKPSFFIVKGSGVFQGGFFDLASNPKGVKVPTGSYEIFYGLIRSGKGRQIQKAVILKGLSKPYLVEEGKTTTIKIGEPFGFDFQWAVKEEQLTVHGNTVSVSGSAGEHYELIWDDVPIPEAQVHAVGGKFTKNGQMKRAGTQELNQATSWGILWHPLDLSFDLPKVTEKLEVKLSQKHKWFGNIESAWK